MSGPLLFLLTSENLNSNEDAVLSDMRKKNIKDISLDEEKYIKDFPEYYEDENIASRINILKTEWNKTERNNDIANYYSNKGTDISRGLGSFVGDFGGMIAGGIVGEIAISKTTNTFRGNLNTSTNINNYKEFPNKVFINDGTPGGTTIAYQNRTTYSNGSMSILQNNLTTGERLFQVINPSGQLIYEKSLTPYQVNALIGTSSSSKILVGDGVVSKVGQVQNNRLVLENTLIWNKITPVYPDISPTFIPRAFIIESNGKKFFVTPNATKHIAEDFIKKHYLADGSDINYALKNQILLKGFGAALDQITNSEIQYGKKYYTDNWEIMINKRSTDKYPAIYHGIIREGVKK